MASKVGRELAGKGFLPRDLPPVFTSKSFGANYTAIVKSMAAGIPKKWTQYEPYSMPRAKIGRRIAGIVNPIPFVGLSEVISVNWKDIKKIFAKSKISFSKPSFKSKDRAISESDFRGFRNSQVTESAGFSFALHADFSRFFPTLYTHAIEWAIHSKATAKASIRSKSVIPLWGKLADEYIRSMQDGQTQGIPIGPDTSYIIAELVACAIDDRLRVLLKSKLHGGRIIDDYVIFFESRVSAEKALSALARATREYQVELNPEKTRIAQVADESRESWAYRLADYSPQVGISQQSRAIVKYTDQAISLFSLIGNQSIGRYAIKVISGEVIHPKNLDIAFACLMRLSRLSPNSMSDVAKFCVSYHKLGFSYKKAAIDRFVLSGLDVALDLGHDSEATWLLWMALEMHIKLNVSVTKKISASNSSPVLLLGKAAENAKLTRGVTQKVFSAKLKPIDLESQNWLLAYEGAMRGWFGWKKADLLTSSLKELSLRDIYFLDLKTSSSRIIKAKKDASNVNFDDMNFSDLDEYFETEIEDDGYDFVADEDEPDEDDMRREYTLEEIKKIFESAP